MVDLLLFFSVVMVVDYIFVNFDELHMCTQFHSCRWHVLAVIFQVMLLSHFVSQLCKSPKISNVLPVLMFVKCFTHFGLILGLKKSKWKVRQRTNNNTEEKKFLHFKRVLRTFGAQTRIIKRKNPWVSIGSYAPLVLLHTVQFGFFF